jgi:hypothetical protein
VDCKQNDNRLLPGISGLGGIKRGRGNSLSSALIWLGSNVPCSLTSSVFLSHSSERREASAFKKHIHWQGVVSSCLCQKWYDSFGSVVASNLCKELRPHLWHDCVHTMDAGLRSRCGRQGSAAPAVSYDVQQNQQTSGTEPLIKRSRLELGETNTWFDGKMSFHCWQWPGSKKFRLTSGGLGLCIQGLLNRFDDGLPATHTAFQTSDTPYPEYSGRIQDLGGKFRWDSASMVLRTWSTFSCKNRASSVGWLIKCLRLTSFPWTSDKREYLRPYSKTLGNSTRIWS